VETWFKFRITCSDIMINYQLSQKFKLLGNDGFNHLTIILTTYIYRNCDLDLLYNMPVVHFVSQSY
jgi:hypothetical protein